MERKIRLYGKYFEDFYVAQTQIVRDKIDYVLDIIKHVEQIPIKFLKHMEGTDGLFEIRVKTTFKSVRIFCFFDEGNIIILTNCIEKKSQKTPKNSIDLAVKLKTEYFKNKN
ncbi:MAG TPA: type II toxin-antitoxin system RelE/ParE family toxin [Saprospiraceae bacterium]|jgi:phage-related protein|nr:type II toxin-antitoxin system RelE/ParE family toxin [Saprospiraceae bacterium]HMT53144.1 type II toxin-antitoxin system RelE/ParE family toxin [Saprospiraceae bacterium]HMT71454.1 type II toxin-antitoxin system RelE/ParE family toxin [Saprospiraceae bacterium]